MGLVKKITIFSLFIAGAFGVFAKINQRRRLAKEALKKNLLSVVFKLIGNTFKLIGCKMKSDSSKGWKRAFMHG